LYTRINEQWPRYLNAWTARIRLLRDRNRHVEAESIARTAIELNPYSVNIRLALVYILEACDKQDAALKELRQACDDLPNYRLLGPQLARLLRGKGDIDAAWEALSVLPETPAKTFEQVFHLRDSKETRRAISFCTDALARDRSNIGLQLEHAEILSDMDEDEAAISKFDLVLEISPDKRRALRGKAACLRALRRFTEAERILLDSIKRKPNYTIFRLELAVTYAQMERRDEGVAQYEKALQINPRDYDLLVGHANALRWNGQRDDAEQALRGAIELLPHHIGLLATMGDLQDERNNFKEALAWFDRALEKSPKFTWALMSKSATLRSLGRFDQAERVLVPALENPRPALNVVIEWGWLLRDRGQLARARQAFKRALKLTVGHQNRADVLHCLGWVAFSEGDSENAVVKFREALVEYPNSNDAKVGLAWTLVHQRHANGEAEAERLCLEVLDVRPRTHMAHTCLGVLYAHQGNLPQAEHHLRRSIEIDPYGGSYVDLGALFVQMDRFDEAEELLRKALERDWYDSQAHIELGGLHLQRDFDGGGDGSDARLAAQHFRQALVIDPARGAAAIGLSLALIKSPGDLLAAERVLRDALRRKDCDQPQWQLLVALARLLIERGDATQRRDLHLEALSTAQEAIELASEQADPHYVAGIAAYKAGESGPEARARPFYRRRALRHFRRCLRQDPTHTEARRVMALAEQGLAVARGSVAGGVALMVVASALLVALWLGFFLTDKVTTVVISTLTPILVGLVALGFVLPFLVRLKLPGGVEADLSASLNQVTSGPTGEVSIGPGRLVGTSSDGSSARSPLSAGPRGELPRLG
ncbi:tetratricopeptide repeat protein, partial [Umezawaea endophytica]